MPKTIKIGTASSQPGTIQYGKWEIFTHPTGHTEFLPVIIAQGKEDGPCIWLTGGIHGNEHTGPLVIYELITQELLEQLKGTIVAIPALSPAGLRTANRVPYHDRTDPNRLWPDNKPPKKEDPERNPPSILEQSYAELFKLVLETADYLIDFHNTHTQCIPFVFRDRVLYRDDQEKEKNAAEAELLAKRLDEMLKAFGHTIINEYPVEKYISEDLHRSTSGAALLIGHIPAFTVELGPGLMPELNVVKAAAAGTRNVMRWGGLLDGEMEPIEGIKVVSPEFPMHRSRILRVEQSCVVTHLVKSGDLVTEGTPLAEMRDVWGKKLGMVTSPCDAMVIGPSSGIYYNPGEMPVYLAIRDEYPLTGPYPKDYFSSKD